MTEPVVAIVGAGPAGVRAAETLARGGVRPILFDEGERPGGQIYRQPPRGAGRAAAELYGLEAAKAAAIHRVLPDLADRVDYRPRTLVWNVFQSQLDLLGPDGYGEQRFDRLILATGAMDRALPFPGWTLPGVFTLGGAQIALKAQGMSIGRRVALVGAGPLLPLVAHQYAKAGARIVAVLDATPFAAKIDAAARDAGGAGDAREGPLVHGPQPSARTEGPIRRRRHPGRGSDAGRGARLSRRLGDRAPRRLRRDRRLVRPAQRDAARRSCRLRLRLRFADAPMASGAHARGALVRARHLSRGRRRRHRRSRSGGAAGPARGACGARGPRPRGRRRRDGAARSPACPAGAFPERARARLSVSGPSPRGCRPTRRCSAAARAFRSAS